MGMPATDTPAGLMTAEELERVSIPGKVTELIRGRLVVREPPSTLHGRVSARLAYYLGAFVYPQALGEIFAQDTGFKIESKPDTVRAPDVAFLVRERAADIPARGYAALAPDLAVEVRSPNDRTGELLGKVAAWLDAGARIVWVIDPERREARVYRPDGTLTIVGATDALDGEDVLPGFTCPLADAIG
jgi:Uma2 family endonuclease